MSQSLSSAPVCVIGAGTMGRGIAQIALAAGHAVSLVDPDPAQLQAATTEILTRLARKDPEGAAEARQRLLACPNLTETPTDPRTVVIEAVLEDLDVKQSVLRGAFGHFGSECILATNTSSLSVTAIAAGLPDPARVVGMHFFNPVPVMRLVEVVRGIRTADHIAVSIAELASSWGKTVAHVRSVPGFIVNRVARAFYGEALRLVEEGAATPDVIDELLRSGAGFRMGPFELMDLIGNDVNYAVTRTVWTESHFDPRFAPSLLQGELVASGGFGRKSGRGFYEYGDASERARPRAEPVDPAALPGKLVLHGHDETLAAIAGRAGVEVVVVAQDGPARLEIPAGSVMVTRGRTAAEESRDLGEPVLVLDRLLDPAGAGASAFSSDDASLSSGVVALLDRAGIPAFQVADVPGLVVARILSMIANEAWDAAYHRIATPEDIDNAMVLGTNYPVGPFAWTARWTTGTVIALLDSLWSAYHDPRYRASRALRAAGLTDSDAG